MKKIIISRTDKLGDVVLTLPMAGIVKEYYPDSFIYFLGENYAAPIVESSVHIDKFISWTQMKDLPQSERVEIFRSLHADTVIHVFPSLQIAKSAKKAGIPLRIGSGRRLYNLFYCNRNLFFSRRKSDRHESQLNINLLEPLGIFREFNLSDIRRYYGLEQIPSLESRFARLLSKHHFNLILHPKSRGSAREWGVENFSDLIGMLPEERFKIFITGTKEEGESLHEFVGRHHKRLTDLTGKLTLEQLISFISKADGLVAASTGPLHIASALGRVAIGLYAPMRPIHPGRWAPVGARAYVLVGDGECKKCKNGGICDCIRNLKPQMIKNILDRIVDENSK